MNNPSWASLVIGVPEKFEIWHAFTWRVVREVLEKVPLRSFFFPSTTSFSKILQYVRISDTNQLHIIAGSPLKENQVEAFCKCVARNTATSSPMAMRI
jgi:hypothetical protein